MKKLKNISLLRDELGLIFNDLRSNKIEVPQAATLAKIGDSMISSSKVELEYSKLKDALPNIPFLENK